jgi:hypothetical protein
MRGEKKKKKRSRMIADLWCSRDAKNPQSAKARHSRSKIITNNYHAPLSCRSVANEIASNRALRYF